METSTERSCVNEEVAPWDVSVEQMWGLSKYVKRYT